MKTAIICVSKHHGNTEKVASAMAESLGADVFAPEDAPNLEGYGLIGFGSGIAYWKHYKELFDFVDSLPRIDKNAFLFSTSGLGRTNYHAPLRRKLEAKGFQIKGEFACKGFDTWALLKTFGGMNKWHPDENDLKRAREFAKIIEGRH